VPHDPHLDELRRWVERHAKLLDEHDERLDGVERRQAVLDMGLALARWLIAVVVPIAAVVVAIWKG
jgi:hypothetical protein